ncbi:MAG: TonB-dependent receptor [Pseudomonadota bacterium]
MRRLPFIFALLSSAVWCAEDELFDLSLDELLDVEVVSASKRPESVFDAPAAVFVITAEDIRRSGVTSIPEALRLAPGIEAAQIDSNKWAISVRGYKQRFSNKLLVLMDGRPIYSPVFSGVFWDIQDAVLEDIDRIEVIRGPGATLWGANAVNGVINILTKNSDDTRGVLISALSGDQERGTISARYGGTLGDIGSYRLFARYFDRESNHVQGERFAADDWQQTRFGYRVDLSPTSIDSIISSGAVYESRAGEASWDLLFEPPYRQLTERTQDTNGLNFSLQWSRALSADDTFTLQTFLEFEDRDWSIADINRTTVDLNTEYRTTRFAGHNLIAGAGYRINDDQITEGSAQRARVVPERREEEVFNVFFQDDIELVPDKWTLTLGSKFEYNDFTGLETQPNVRLLWKPSSQVSWWASASRAVRTPGRADRDYQVLFDILPPQISNAPGSDLPIAVTTGGVRDFPSEVLLAYELGVKLRPLATLTLDLATYYFDYDRLRTVEPVGFSCEPDSSAFPVCVLSDQTTSLRFDTVQAPDAFARSRGIEISGDWRPNINWRLQGNYSFFSGEERVRGGIFGGVDSLRTSPRHQASLRLGYIPASNWETDIWVRYVDEILSLDGVPIDRYVTADVRLAWLPKNSLELSFVAKGLFNDSQAQFVSQPIDIPLTEIERSMFLQLRVNF